MSSRARGRHHEQRELRADRERQGHAEQQRATPVPQDDFTGCVQRVGNCDGGEDGSESAPGRARFRLRKARPTRRESAAGREAVKSECYESAFVAV